MKKTFAFWLLTLICAGASAKTYDMQVGGIYYKEVKAGELAVTAGDNTYFGTINIPATVEAEGRSWRVTAIDDAAFYGCHELYRLTLPASVTAIGNEAFVRCPYLQKFTVADNNTAFCDVEGVLMDKQQKSIISFPAGSATSYSVPEGVETIGKWAFTHCERLAEIGFPSTLHTIDDAAFFGCSSLKNIVLPDNLQTVGVWAFSECKLIHEITIPVSMTAIGDGAFSFCSALQNIYVATGNSAYTSTDGVLMDKQQHIVMAFPSGRKGDYRLPATVDSIATQAFYGADLLEHVTLSASLSSMKESPFVFCEGLKGILVDQDNKQFASVYGVLFNKDHTQLLFFPNGKKGNFSIPHGVTELNHGPFLGSTAVTGIDIPSTVTTIGDWTFLGCRGLNTVTIPYSVKTIGQQTFSDCPSLQSIVCNGEPASVSSFEMGTNEGTMLYVPMGRSNEYKGATGWGSIWNIEEFGLFAANQTLERGQLSRVPINMTRTLPVTSALLDITLPEGITLATDTDGTPIVEVSAANAATHTISCADKGNGTYSLTIKPMAGNALAKGDTLAYITVRAATDSQTGVYDMTLKHVSFTYLSGIGQGEALQNDAISGLNVKLFVGDVNRNGRLNVADVVETMRYVNGIANDTFHFEEADVNVNGEVNNTDADIIVGRIHQTIGSPLVVNDFWQTGGETTTSDRLSATAVTAEDGSDFMLDISLEATHNLLTAYQFLLPLPKGFSLQTDDEGLVRCVMPEKYRTGGRAVTAMEVPGMKSSNGGPVYSVVCTSASLSTLSNGALISIPMKTIQFIRLDNYQIPVQQIVFADTDGHEYYLTDATASITIKEGAGIVDLRSDQEAAKGFYDLGGRKVDNSRQGAAHQLNKGVYIIEGRKVVIQ